jgi:ABC-type Zn uptake system ZnuABC Zn-binding protein ZnuA
MNNMSNETIKENPEGSLTFQSPEKAQEFAERVMENLEKVREDQENAEANAEKTEQRVKEAIKEELQNEVAGIAPVTAVEGRGEWQYTQADSDEVQRYVNIAFATDINNAVEALMREKLLVNGNADEASVLRTLDLFHDTLTDHLYRDLEERKMLS